MRGRGWSAVCVLLTALWLTALGLPSIPAAVADVADAPPQPVAAPGSDAQPGTPPITEPQPVMSLWNATTRTYAQPDGSYEAQIFPTPVNYKTPDGSWAPIVNTLAPSSLAGYEARNQAGPYTVQLPDRLESAPVRLQAGGSWLSFSLGGAKGAGSVSGSTDTFSGAMPGVDVVYTAVNDGVKEITRLADAAAPSSFTYTLETSPDLTPQETADGGMAFVDGSDRSKFTMSAPVVQDASGATGPASMSLQVDPAAPTITVSVDPGWLKDPARAFPVTIDPSVTITGATQQCYIASSQSDFPPQPGWCGGSLTVGRGEPPWGVISRSLLQFDLSSVPSNATVTNAQLGLRLATATTAATSVSVQQVTSAWGSASWHHSSYQGPFYPVGHWNTPGGDFVAAPASTNPAVGPAVGTYYWYPTRLVQGWTSGTIANNGFLLKLTNEGQAAGLSFDTPVLTVTYNPWLGYQPYQPFYTDQLTDRMGIAVNLADGNLLVANQDLQISGTGLGLSIPRYYNSMATGTINVGAQWELGTGAGIKLNTFADGSADYRGPDGVHYPFIRNPDGSFIQPAGLDAVLVQNANGSYTMTFTADETRYNFTSSGKLTSEVDRNGNTITFAYTATTLNSITDTQGRVTSFTYGTNGLISRITDPAGRLYQYGYSAANDLITYTDPGGGVTAYAYDAQHNMTQITDAVGNVTKIAYALGGVSSITRVTDPANGTGPTTTFSYSPKAPGPGTATVTASDGHRTSYEFDGLGRQTKVTDPLGNSSSFTYDDANHVTSATDPLTNVYPITYDQNHNVVSQRLPTGATSRATYTNAAHPWSATTSTDPQGNVTTYGYDAAGNLTSVTDALASNNTATYAYNANGTVASATDAMGRVTTYTYDAKGNLKKATPPSPLGVIKYTYDALSRIATTTDGLGRVTTYTYDQMDRVTSTAYAGGITVSATYDRDGNVLTQTDPTGTTTYAYNALGQQTQKTLPGGGTFTYTWDGEGNLLTVTDSGGTVSYTYDAADRASSVTDPFGGTTTLTYDAAGNETRRVYPNGSLIQRYYDASSRITRIDTATSLQPFDYSYAKQGTDTTLRQTMSNAGNTTTYTYDAANRLLRAQTTGSIPSDYLYTYDGVGNRLSQIANGSTTTYTYNAANELTAAGSTTYTYDKNGNQTGSSAGLSLSYNTANQNNSATPPGGSAIPMTYAGNGQTTRTSAGATTYRYGLLGLASETTAGVTTYYVYDPSGGLIEEWTSSSNRYFYLYDGLGSVVGLTDMSRTLVNTYRYDPYGNVVAKTGTTPNRFGFAGGYRDDTGFLKFGQRYYDPTLGSWTQPAPEPASVLNPAIASAYTYVGGDPVNNVDPTGAFRVGWRRPRTSGGHWAFVISGDSFGDVEITLVGYVGRVKVVTRAPAPGQFCFGSPSFYNVGGRCRYGGGPGVVTRARWGARLCFPTSCNTTINVTFDPLPICGICVNYFTFKVYVWVND